MSRVRHDHGFTYLWLLFAVAAGAAGLAVLGPQTRATLQRDREAELRFRGCEIQHAIGAYWQQTPSAAKELPRSLQDLVDDRRGPTARHHLRRVYADPFTGQPDWKPITTDDGHLLGVHSRAEVAAMKTVDLPAPPAGAVPLVSDRRFIFEPTSEPAASPIGSSSAGERKEKSSNDATLSALWGRHQCRAKP